jgi:membrane protein required for colicin V production
MSSVSAADWVLLLVLALSLLVGAWRGLVFEVLSVLGWVAAFFAAQWLAPLVAPMLPLATASASIQFAAAFVLSFIAAVFAAGFLATLMRKLVSAAGLRPADRVLGSLFGLVRGVIVLLAATVAIDMTPLKGSAWWQDSAGAPILTSALNALKPVLPAQFARYLK